jgi:PAS domain S-box-containing protein
MKFKDFTISAKLGVILFSIVIFTFINFIAVIYVINAQQDKAVVIDVVGRNRMLSLRMALLLQNVKQHSVEDELMSTLKVLNNSISILRQGGTVNYLGEQRQVSPVPPHLLPQVANCEDAVRVFERKVNQIITDDSFVDTPPSPYDSLPEGIGNFTSSKDKPLDDKIAIDNQTQEMVAQFNNLVAALVAESEKQQRRLFTLAMALLALTILTTFTAFWVTRRFVSSPLSSLSKSIEELGDGDIRLQLNYGLKDEVGHAYQGLRRLMDNIQKAVSFAHEIARGNFAFSYSPAGDRDELGKALINMRTKLQEVAIDDKKRNWATEGLAKFADILRTDHKDVTTLSNVVVAEIVNYMDCNQGSLFIVNDDDPNNPFMQLIASYAWNKKKFLNKTIAPGEGLVGQAWLEKDVIYLKAVPDDYIEITSGLGSANPRSIIIVPLKLEQHVFGILELASFNDMEAHQRDFLMKLSENLASTISAAKIADRTKRLLEQSQQQAEELRAQEEEMRQNMEELQATQEEIMRKTNETEGRLRAVDESGIASVEFNLDGTIIGANDNFLKLMEYSHSEIVGKHHRMFVSPAIAMSPEYRKFWEDLANGIPRPGQYERVTKSGKRVTIQGSYSIIRDTNGKPIRILKLANDITGLMQMQQTMLSRSRDSENRLQAIDESGIASIEFKLDGTIVNANNNFLRLMEYSLDEIKGRHHRLFVDPLTASSTEYKIFWDDLAKGIARPGQYERRTSTGRIVIIQGSYSILRDDHGMPTGILKFANDVTEFVLAARKKQSIENGVPL